MSKKYQFIVPTAIISNPFSEEDFNAYLAWAAIYHPKGNTPFNWEKSNDPTLAVESIVIKWASELEINPDYEHGQYADSLTTIVKTKEGGLSIHMNLSLEILKKGDAFERTVTALAREIYGNMTYYLGLTQDEIEDLNFKDKQQIRLLRGNAFQAGLDFLGRLIKSKNFSELPDNVQENFQEAYMREYAFLKYWEDGTPIVGNKIGPRL